MKTRPNCLLNKPGSQSLVHWTTQMSGDGPCRCMQLLVPINQHLSKAVLIEMQIGGHLEKAECYW